MQVLGCFGTRGGNLLPIDTWPPAGTDSAKPIAVRITGFREWTAPSGRRYRLPDVTQTPYRESILQAFADAGLSSRISEAAAPGERTAHVDIQATESAKGFAWLTTLTLFLVPYGRIHTYNLQMTWIDDSGDVTSTCQRSEAAELWWHLAFVFTLPFTEPSAVAPAVCYDLVRACLLEAAAAGAL